MRRSDDGGATFERTESTPSEAALADVAEAFLGLLLEAALQQLADAQRGVRRQRLPLRLALDHLGIDAAHMLGGCMGCCPVTAFAVAQPERVAGLVHAMRAACALPVTVKHRIGVDDLDRYEDMLAFVTTVAEAGCDRFGRIVLTWEHRTFSLADGTGLMVHSGSAAW